jgi:hypothetical protein
VSNGKTIQLLLEKSKANFSQLPSDSFQFFPVEAEDLALVTNYSVEDIKSMAEDKKETLTNSFRKITGVLFDTDVNDHGFAMSAEALKFMVEHFNRTKENTPHLHNFFIDHRFDSVEKMLGRVTSLQFDTENNQQIYEAMLSNSHPFADRYDLMKSVSGTIIRGGLECNSCGDPYSGGWFPEPSCDHIPNGKDVFPITNKAVHIETSFVTFPAYKKTSVELVSNYSSCAGILQEEFPEDFISSDTLASMTSFEAGDPKTIGEKENQDDVRDMMELMSILADVKDLLEVAVSGLSTVLS